MGEEAPKAAPFFGQATAWIGIVSSVVTILLTILNGYTKSRIDAADVRLKQHEQEITEKFKEREANLQDSKDRISRYTFVKSLLPEVIGKDETDRSLTINLVRLTLTNEEAERLFNGLKLSGSRELQSLGSEGVSQIHQEKGEIATASANEEAGFQHLADGKIDDAIKAFDAADRAYPTYHNVHEIATLLRQLQPSLGQPDAKKKLYGRILEQYSWGMKEDMRARLRQLAGAGG